MALISGIVRDQDGTPVARTVRAYRRDTGALLAETNSAGGPAVTGDAYISQVISLLHMDGSARDVKGDALSVAGTISYSAGLFGEALSITSGDSGLVESAPSGRFNLPGDFTAELWFKSSGSTTDQVMVNRFALGASAGNGWQIAVNPNMEVLFWIYVQTGTSGTLMKSAAVSKNVWHHAACSRVSGAIKLFVDGLLIGTATSSADFTSSAALLSIGHQAQGSARYPFRGLIEDVRITKGVGRYTSNFVVPDAALPDSADDIPERSVGEYAMSVPYAGEVQVLCLDDAEGELQNDQVLRTFPV